MRKKTSHYIFFAMTVTIILVCMYLMYIYSGFEHESDRCKNILVTIAIVLIFQFVIADPIKFVLMSIDMACWPPKLPEYRKDISDDEEEYNRLNFVKQRLKSLRIQLVITERHRNDILNEQYKSITLDLILFGKYLFVLTCLVLVTRDQLLYYNTARLQRLFMNNHTDYLGLAEVYDISQLFDFVESTLVDAFDYEDDAIGSNNWVHSEQTKMLGVVRMRQLRLLREQMGWGNPVFSDFKHMPDWVLPYRRLHYVEKYWRVFEPWIPITDEYDFLDALLMNFDHVGKFQNYPELRGYISLLARDKQNSMKILDFLTEYHWLNQNTSAVFLDFTLYNVDANMFSVCTLRVERTPFGSIIPDVDCDTIMLIEELEQQAYVGIIVIFIYFIVVLEFAQRFFVHVWFEPSKMHSIWFKLDLLIVVLNVVIIILVICRASLATTMLRRLEGANKLEFLDFRRPTRLYKLTTILIGFLICVTTLRLWKVLQFSKVFQLFTTTLFMAWKTLAVTMIAILIILMAFGIAFTTINGNNSAHFLRLFKSIITSLCFSFGFTSELKPAELFYGGKFLGMFLYATLGFVVSVMLINVFLTIINDYFGKARADHYNKSERQISFFEFLRVEYFNIFEFFRIKRGYNRNNRTVSENIDYVLEKRAKIRSNKKRLRRSLLSSKEPEPVHVKDEKTLQAEYREGVEHVLAVSTIMKTQLEILNLILFPEDDDTYKKFDSDQASDDEDEDKPQGSKRKSKEKRDRNTNTPDPNKSVQASTKKINFG